MEPHHLPAFESVQGNHRQFEQLISQMPNYRKPKRRRSAIPNANPKRAVPGTRQRDWTEDETSALLELVNLPEYRPQRRTRNKQTDWERIAEAMQRKVGPNPAITVKRCKERMKTLTGDRYFTSVTSQWKRMKTENENITGDALRELIVAHGLTEDWYKAITEYKAIQRPCDGRERSLLVQTTDGPCENMDIDHHNLTPDAPSDPCPSAAEDHPSQPIQTISPQNVGGNVSIRTQFATRFNSLNKLQMSTLLDLQLIAEYLDALERDERLSTICEWVSIVQKRSPLEIYEDVIALKKMGLMRRESDDGEGEGSDDDEVVFSESFLDVGGLLMHKKFFKKAVDRNPAYDTRRIIADNPMETFDATSAPSGITMLYLLDCHELKVVDLSGFRKLRFLAIYLCQELREIVWCECPEELGWLEISHCYSYQGYPPLQKMPSLQEFRFCKDECYSSEHGHPGGELDVSGCVRLRVLEIVGDWALSSIRGLEGLRSLTALELCECKALRNLPDIGHMKDLTHLSLQSTPVEEIKGIEKLSSLKKLRCGGSKLKALPDLSHLPHLPCVQLGGCPVVDDPSSPYYKQPWRRFGCDSKHVYVSDTESENK